MAIEKHLEKPDNMSYDAREIPEQRWYHHLADRVLRHFATFKDDIHSVGSRVLEEEAIYGQQTMETIPGTARKSTTFEGESSRLQEVDDLKDNNSNTEPSSDLFVLTEVRNIRGCVRRKQAKRIHAKVVL